MNRVGGVSVVVVLLLTLPVAATGSAIATQPAVESPPSILGSQDDEPVDGADSNGQPNESETNETDETETIRHQDPDQYRVDGDLDGLEGWLERELAGQLQDSAIELGEGEADLAREHVDEEYRERLGQYVTVSGETEGEGHEERFEDAGEEQARLVDAVDEYQERKAAYETAREEGDEERAREEARELEALSAEIDESSQNLDDHYDEISTETDTDLSAADESIDRVSETIESEQAAVRDEQFVETELTLEAAQSTVSFLDPLSAAGELQTADGSSIGGEEIQLEIGNTTEQVRTDSDGSFELEYRPTTLPLETTELPVAYVPDDDAEYLGTETDVDVTVEQESPTLSSVETPDEVAYGESVPIGGQLAVDDEPVDDVSLSVTLDGQQIGTVPVSNGTIEETVEIPASVPAGDRELGLVLPDDDRALAGTTATETVTVRETETTLSANATAADDDLRVDGALDTAEGDELEGEPVQLRVDGTPVETVETDGDGEFEETIPVPDTAEGTVTVLAVYDDSSSNLADADAETDVTVPGAESGTIVPTWLWIGLGIVGIAVVGGTWWHRRSPTAPATIEEPPRAAESDPRPDRDGASSGGQSLRAEAETRLAGGQPDAAVRFAYAAVRGMLGGSIDDNGLTHWEFYRRLKQTDDVELTDHETEQLRSLTSGYERAVFGPDRLSEQMATALLERATRLCEREDVSESKTTPGPERGYDDPNT